jgi:hypothetical protein
VKGEGVANNGFISNSTVLNWQVAVQSSEYRMHGAGLRVCASGEPESEPKGPSPGCSVNR